MLNLRQVGQDSSQAGDTMYGDRFSALAFAIPESRITGNLGEDLYDLDTDSQEDYDSAGGELDGGNISTAQVEVGSAGA